MCGCHGQPSPSQHRKAGGFPWHSGPHRSTSTDWRGWPTDGLPRNRESKTGALDLRRRSNLTHRENARSVDSEHLVQVPNRTDEHVRRERGRRSVSSVAPAVAHWVGRVAASGSLHPPSAARLGSALGARSHTGPRAPDNEGMANRWTAATTEGTRLILSNVDRRANRARLLLPTGLLSKRPPVRSHAALFARTTQRNDLPCTDWLEPKDAACDPWL